MTGSSTPSPSPSIEEWLIAGGEMGDLIRSRDWSDSPLGPRQDWPLCLRTVVNLVVENRFPMALLWGRELLLVYNDAFAVVAGDRHPDALGRSPREIGSEVWHINTPICEAVMKRGETRYLEDKLFSVQRHGHPEDAYFTLSFSPVRESDGSIAGTLVTLLETTKRIQEHELLRAERDRAAATAEVRERKRVEKELKQALGEAEAGKYLLDALLENIPLGIAIADASDFRFRAISRFGREFSGLTKDQFATMSVMGDFGEWTILRADGSPCSYEDLPLSRAILHGAHVREEELILLRSDGTRIPILCAAGPIRDGQGVVVGGVTGWQDMTEVMKAQEQLRESDRRKDEFLAMLGHELRNPLAAIRSAAELMKLTAPEDARLQRAYGVLHRQSTHMTRLIDGLLEVSRIARGKIELELETVDIKKVLDTVLADRAEEIQARGLQTATDVPTTPLWVRGDCVRLAQVFDNLVGNAIKFTTAPGRIHVTLHDDSGFAVIRVRDTGIGIRPEVLERVFDPFQQEAQDVSRAAGGLGLGLALAKGLVELHGGCIEARSPGPGQGAEFEIRLPTITAPARVHRPTEAPHASRRRVLVVEDNADAGQMLRELLELAGHEVTLVGTANEALHTLRERGTDVVLCDLGLPGMGGHDFARAVREDPSLRDTRLLAVTGYGQPTDRERSLESGFDEHLTKPVDLKTLDAALERQREA